jgi:2-dehydro-3-deoxy-L-rhamnonate dehydrogenase (NAD+)
MQRNHIDLSDRVAVVTGGAQGIGHAITQRFLRSGAHVAIWDVNTTRMQQARSELQESGIAASRIHAETVDIANAENVEAAVRGTVEGLGRIDILVNNAAIVGPNRTLADYPLDAWADVIKST